MYTDCGTQFICPNAELKGPLQFMQEATNKTNTITYYSNQGIECKFNLSAATHLGGFLKRMKNL